MLTRLYAAAMVLVVLSALSGCSLATLPLYAVDKSAFNGERAEAPSYWPQGWPRIWSN
jgi:cytochrome c biogenesis protein CcdA